MKSKLLLLVIAAVLLVGSSAFAQDLDTVGVTDTVAIVLDVDTVGMSATMELWVYSDEVLNGATIGFTWGDSPTTHFTIDSAIASPAIIAGFDLGRFFFENSDLATTNANQRFLFGGSALFSGGLAPQSSRRLWATYYFSISQWDGWDNDGIKIDTLAYSPGSAYLFIGAANFNFLPWFEGSKEFGNPALAIGDNPEGTKPDVYALSQNYPNPFNPSTEISYSLPAPGHVKLTIYNILGQEVTTLVDDYRAAGSYAETWDASEYSTGVYFYKLTADKFTETRKMMLLK